MSDLGRMLLVFGAILVVVGAVLLVGGRLFPWLGNLPGDIRYESENVKIFIPITTMILISIVLTIVINVVIRIIRR